MSIKFNTKINILQLTFNFQMIEKHWKNNLQKNRWSDWKIDLIHWIISSSIIIFFKWIFHLKKQLDFVQLYQNGDIDWKEDVNKKKAQKKWLNLRWIFKFLNFLLNFPIWWNFWFILDTQWTSTVCKMTI